MGEICEGEKCVKIEIGGKPIRMNLPSAVQPITRQSRMKGNLDEHEESILDFEEKWSQRRVMSRMGESESKDIRD